MIRGKFCVLIINGIECILIRDYNFYLFLTFDCGQAKRLCITGVHEIYISFPHQNECNQ